MKTAIFTALAISLSLPATAQQGVYQPRLDQDNAAATLPDTIKFILDTANNPGLTQAAADATEDYEGFELDTFAASSPSASTLSWTYLDVDLGSYNMGANTTRSTYTVDLSKIDLASIKAVPYLGNVSNGFEIQFSAMPGSTLGTDTVYHLNQDHGLGWFEHNKYWKSLTDAETAQCAAKDKKCSTTQTNATTAVLFVNNQDSAMRVSRALLHAALLSGAKSSAPPAAPSPF